MTKKWQDHLAILSLLILSSIDLNLAALAVPKDQSLKLQSSPSNIESTSSRHFKQAQADLNRLTEANIRQVLTLIQTAGNQQDIAEILQYVAPFAHSEISLNLGNSILTTSVNGTEEHRNLLAQTYNKFKERNTINEKVDILVSADGEFAIATVYRIREVTDEQGKQFISGSVNTLRFGMVNEQPMIVSAALEGWLSERPSLIEQPEVN
ncbi:MAG TPA: hypothetical protein ACFCUY_19075 [Xenococcaceae cyanobacterium]